MARVSSIQAEYACCPTRISVRKSTVASLNEHRKRARGSASGSVFDETWMLAEQVKHNSHLTHASDAFKANE